MLPNLGKSWFSENVPRSVESAQLLLTVEIIETSSEILPLLLVKALING